MEVMCTSETSVNFYQPTRRHISEDSAVHTHRCEKIRFHEDVKLSLSLIKHHVIQTYGGVEVQMMALLTSALDTGEQSASRPIRFNPKVKAHVTHRIGGWVVLRDVEKKVPLLPSEIEPQFSFLSGLTLVSILTVPRWLPKWKRRGV
jgi:hypothetical protein